MKKSSLVVFIFCLTQYVFSQKEASYWYFSSADESRAGIKFNGSLSPSYLTDGMVSYEEGCSSMSDENGNLLFYTDGETVWNKNHAPMPNGTGLWGHRSSAQSSVIVNNPCDNSLYYIFTSDGKSFDALGLKDNFPFDSVFAYSIVDMKLNGGLGDIVIKNVKLFSPVNETVAAVRHANGHDTWIIAHKHKTDSYYAYLVDKNGISGPVVSHAGIFPSDYTIGYVKFSPNGKYFAHNDLAGRLILFGFDNSTGVLNNPQVLTAIDGYGISFSSNSNVLYANQRTGVGNLFGIYQYNLLAGSATAIGASRTAIFESTSFLGPYPYAEAALQLGIDGKIYTPFFYKNYLGVIHSPNTIGAGCNFVPNGLSLGPRTGGIGLPNFIESYFNPGYITTVFNEVTANFSNDRVCVGDSNTFTNLSLNSTTWQWNFGDPLSNANKDSLFNTKHFYEMSGTYQTRLIASNYCYADTLLKTIIVDTVPDLVISSKCVENLLVLDAGNPLDGYIWSTGQTTQTIYGEPSKTYSLTLINSCGSYQIDTTITENPCLNAFYWPNAFTPNGDNINDVFIVNGSTAYHFNMKIYTRWGELIFESNDIQKGWNGMYKGKIMAEGLYIYQININDEAANGSVTLVH